MSLKVSIVVIVIILLAVITVFLLNNEEQSDSPAKIPLPEELISTKENPVTEMLASDTENSTEPESKLDVSDNSAKEIVRSIYDADRDFRDAAIAEAERSVAANFTSNRGILRWETVWIDSSDLIVGDLSLQDAVSNEFRISIFADVSYKATETVFHPLDINNAAHWKGVLDDGESGTIEMTIMQGTEETSLIIRMRGPAGQFLVYQTEHSDVYVAAEADVAYLRNRPID